MGGDGSEAVDADQTTTLQDTQMYLRVDRLPNGRRRLVRDLALDLKVDVGIPDDTFRGFTIENGHTRVVVPAGFETDFSSIPAPARIFYRFSSVDLAGVCHDWAYRIGVDRRKADRCWRIIATRGEVRVGTTLGWLGYLALRIGGGFAYRSNREKRLAGDLPPEQDAGGSEA